MRKRKKEPARPALGSLLPSSEDRIAFQKLVHRFRMREHAPAAVIGAGLSRPLNYPTWNELLRSLHRLAETSMNNEDRQVRHHFQQLQDSDDVIWRAQEYRDAIARDREYKRFLKRSFSPRSGRSPALDLLLQLPCRHFLTTNYDAEIERAHARVLNRPIECVDWMDSAQSAALVSSWSDPNTVPKCVYLHGRYDDPDNIVLTESDYQRAYFKVSGNAQRLASILLLYPVVFLGFSLQDPDFMAIMRQANALGFSGARHFALMGLSTAEDERACFLNRARLRRKFGIAAIFYRAGERHGGLQHLLSHLQESLADDPIVRPVVPPPHKITGRYAHAKNREYPDDPLKGRFGGLSEVNTWRYSAHVERCKDDPYWFDLVLKVTPRPGSRKRLRGQVTFWVHPTFTSSHYTSRVFRNQASCKLLTTGSFTAGAVIHQDGTKLELDLAEIDGVPLDFQLA